MGVAYHHSTDYLSKFFNCATLELSERFRGWLRKGILMGELKDYPESDRQRLREVLVLRSVVPSYSDEEIGRAGLRWAGDLVWAEDRNLEHALKDRYWLIKPELERRVDLVRLVHTR